jgi:hypothetical protein
MGFLLLGSRRRAGLLLLHCRRLAREAEGFGGVDRRRSVGGGFGLLGFAF